MRSTLLICLALLVATPALACSPMYDTRSLTEQAAALPELFVGRVVEVGEDSIKLEVLASRGTPEAGETVSRAHKSYGTCDQLEFAVGEIWLYDTDMPLSFSRRIEPADLGSDNGKDIDALVQHVQNRLAGPQE